MQPPPTRRSNFSWGSEKKFLFGGEENVINVTLRHENNRSVNKLIFDKRVIVFGFYLLKVIPLHKV